MKNIELFNDHFQNYKVYGLPKAQLIIADVPYNLGNNAYASNPSWYVDDDNKYDFIMCHNGRFFLLSQENHVIRNGHPLKKHGSIDCGTNEGLFIALAALRDDTDNNQWFTDGNDWFLCQYLKVGMHYQDKPEILFEKWHKATVEELIEHFKEKENR